MTYGLTVTNPRIFKFGNSILFNTLTEAPSSGGGGSTGSSGNQGPQGIYGPTGTIGSQGFQGFIGITGPRGFQGPVSTGSSQWITSGTSIYYNTGNVGIGTSSPTFPLDVNGQIVSRGQRVSTTYGNTLTNFMEMYVDGTNSILQGYSSLVFKPNSGITEAMRITSAGNVGIGTTSPNCLLQVYKGAGGSANQLITSLANASNDINWQLGTFNGATTNLSGDNMLSMGMYYYGQTAITSGLNFYRGSSFSDTALGLYAGNAERMRITTAGNVGIGTTGPNAKLDVAGSIYSTSSSNDTITSINSGNGQFGTIECFNAANTIKRPLSLQGYGGNVGIGTTVPLAPIHVLSSSTGYVSVARLQSNVDNYNTLHGPRLDFYTRFLGNSSSYFQSAIAGTTIPGYSDSGRGGMRFLVNSANSELEAMRVDWNGNVGIGTTTPLSLLNVKGKGIFGTTTSLAQPNTDDCLYLENSTGTNSYSQLHIAFNDPVLGANGGFLSINKTGAISGFGGTDAGFNIWTNTNIPIKFATNGSERMRLTTAGNVGIGSTNPSGALHIDSSTQLRPRINLTGQEFYQAANTSTEGVSMLLGVNRTNNRQLWIADSSKLAQNSSNPACRIIVGTSDSTIDCVGTIGNVNLPIQFGNTTALTTVAGSGVYMNGKVGIGTTTPQGLLSVNLANSTNNTIPGGINAWDSTYSVFGPGAGNISGGGIGLGWNSNLGGVLTCIQPNVSWNTMNYQAATHRFYVMGASFTGPSMVITPTGRIGIGTGSPDYTLHVSSNEQNPFGVTSTTTTAYPNINFLFPNLTTSCYFNLGQGGSNNNMAFGWNVVGGVGATTNYLSFTINAIGDVFRAYSNNTNTNIQLNKYTTNGTLQTINSNGTLSASSDIRLKNSIESLTGTYMDKVMGLNPVSFKYNQDQYNTHLGFIAQDVEKVLPLAVDGKKHDYDFLRDERGDLILDADGNPQEDPEKKTPRYRGLNTTAIVAVLTKGIQEQQQTITQLQSTIEAQQSTLATQQQTINDLLARVIALENKNI